MENMIPIRVTEVLSDPRSYQYKLENVKPLPPNFYAMRGTMLHREIEAHFKEGGSVGRFEKFLGQLKKWEVDEEGYLGRKLKDSFFSLCENVQKWINETELNISHDNILSIEAEMMMPIRGEYHLVGHADIITKTHIIDLKSGRVFRNYDYIKQLGAYRDLARYLGLHDEALTGDFELVNVFFGERDGFG